MTIPEAITALRVPGTRFSGADWKYGWPHKFYVGDGKVYNYHLGDLSDAELAAWSAVSEKFFGVTWAKDDNGGFKFHCPYRANIYGYQRAGVVGPDGEPVRNDEWSVDFPREKQDGD